jgi:hypothetical protein
MQPEQPASARGALQAEQRGILIIAILTAIGTMFIGFADTGRFLPLYFMAVMLWTEVAVGCLGLVLLNHLVNGRWLFISLRFAEAGARTLPFLLLFFIPILGNLEALYPWAEEGRKALEGGKDGLLQPGFFIVRTLIYFAIWSVLAYLLTFWSYRRDRVGGTALEDRARTWSAIGAVIYVVTTSLAAFDWSMSLTPDWFSSIYGWLTLSRQALTVIALLILILAFLWNRAPLQKYVTDRIVGDFAALLLVALLTWGYLNVMQLIVIWSGNIAYNTAWYLPRITDSWTSFTVIFVVSHIALLVLMLIPGLKRQKGILITLAAAMLILRLLEVYWVIMPNFDAQLAPTVLLDMLPMVTLGAFWLAATFWLMEQQPLLPVHHITLAHDTTAFGEDGVPGRVLS